MPVSERNAPVQRRTVMMEEARIQPLFEDDQENEHEQQACAGPKRNSGDPRQYENVDSCALKDPAAARNANEENGDDGEEFSTHAVEIKEALFHRWFCWRLDPPIS